MKRQDSAYNAAEVETGTPPPYPSLVCGSGMAPEVAPVLIGPSTGAANSVVSVDVVRSPAASPAAVAPDHDEDCCSRFHHERRNERSVSLGKSRDSAVSREMGELIAPL